MSNSVDPDETWIYVVCKMLLLLPVAVKELKNILLFVSRFVFLPIYGLSTVSHSCFMFTLRR